MSLLTAAVLLSWLGIREIAGGCWILTFGAAIYSAIINNLVMGVYVLSGFLGILLHSGLNPGELIQGLKNEYLSSVYTPEKLKNEALRKALNNDISQEIKSLLSSKKNSNN